MDEFMERYYYDFTSNDFDKAEDQDLICGLEKFSVPENIQHYHAPEDDWDDL